MQARREIRTKPEQREEEDAASAVAETPLSARWSPEAEIGMRVEDIWDSLDQPQLSRSDKLNSCFDAIPVSSFPQTFGAQLVDIPSDATLAEAVDILSRNRINGAPVRNVEAPEDASWIDRYIGIVEFAGIAVWLLHRSEASASAAALGADELAAKLGTVTLDGGSGGGGGGARELKAATEAEGAVAEAFGSLPSSELFRKTKVKDISGSFRWAPFLALQSSGTFLTMLLLLSKYRMKSLPVVDIGEGTISNMVTQAAVVHMLAECVGLSWFEDWGTKTLAELGLPLMKTSRLVKVCEDEPALKAFRQMRRRGVGGIPVVDGAGKPVGSIMIKDVKHLLTASESAGHYRTLTAREFIASARQSSGEKQMSIITCTREDNMKEIILKLDAEKRQRIYVVDGEGNLDGLITLRDIIAKLVYEPPGYFGDFFNGVIPMPQNSRV
ncbi:SNF1-related protein kinase regulatory subunit gamma-1-like [Triticum dicoccoides]|uniref:SNF1-related protein kinase regulatory subunit gamma-1-like n=1 Tax=Triticum dicoccoides TaxID=85692 RepID=UPI000E7CE4D9|nr:SNF1-related protein kinase regulatory subunit gamma-1-like [Triticum dicoccoides]